MSAVSPPPVKRKRVRTASQLEQKRFTDRIKHRENRHENKNRLDKIEGDIADIKATLHALAVHLQSQVPIPAPPDPSITWPGCQELGLLRPREGAFYDSSASAAPHLLLGAHLGPEDQALEPQAWASWPPTSPEDKGLWTPIPCIESKLINCQCGLQHLDRFDSLDRCNVTTFYQHQIASLTARRISGILPRNPSLPSMMLHTMDENIATFLITGFLRQYKNKGIEQLLSFYLLGYRYMRVSEGPQQDRNETALRSRPADSSFPVANEPMRRNNPRCPSMDAPHRDPKIKPTLGHRRLRPLAAPPRPPLHKWG